MAVKKTREAVNIEVTPDINTQEVKTQDLETLSVNTGIETKVEDIPQVEPIVKIRMRVDHNCNIGTERYYFVKGKVYNVPENVKRILNQAGLLAPL